MPSETEEEIETRQCIDCGEEARSWVPDRNGDPVCSYCADDHWGDCEDCGNIYNLHTNDGDTVCDECLRGDRVSYRSFSSSDKHQSREAGKAISSMRKFGIEIELLAKTKEAGGKICKQLPKECGVGGDGSIRGDYGLEITTPVLRGKAGERLVKKITKTLRQLATVNASCGLHIHLDASGMLWSNIKKIMLFYVSFDEVIMAMLPRGRRKSSYAKSLKATYSYNAISNASSLEELHRVWYRTEDKEKVRDIRGSKYNQCRHYGINFHSFFNSRNVPKTIEVRYHSPTLSPKKILNWVALHQFIVDKAPNINSRTLKVYNDLLFFEDKMAELKRLLPDELYQYVRGRIILFNPKHSKLCVE